MKTFIIAAALALTSTAAMATTSDDWDVAAWSEFCDDYFSAEVAMLDARQLQLDTDAMNMVDMEEVPPAPEVVYTDEESMNMLDFEL